MYYMIGFNGRVWWQKIATSTQKTKYWKWLALCMCDIIPLFIKSSVLGHFLLVFRVIRYTGTCKKLFYCIWKINLDMDIIKVFKGCRNVEKVGREGGLLAFQGKLIRCLSKLSKCWRGIAPTTLSSVDPMTKVLLYYL